MESRIALFSVAGGKYHKPGEDITKPWRPTKTACGLIVTPENYFETAEEANKYTGGRLARFQCAHCAKQNDTRQLSNS